MTEVYWTCADCSTLGATDRTAEQHTKATTHTTLTGVNPETLARMLGKAAVVDDE